jgi:peptidoglycan/LPS O-acetylase OafA/YrhL
MITLVFYFGHVQYHAAQKKDAYYGLINAYKALPANLHKMLAGAMLRLIPLPNFMFSRYSSYIGLSGLIVLFTYIQIANHAPWHTFNFVTLCTIPLLTGAIEHQNFVFNLRILRFFGRISYALYLWHEVFIFFIRVHRGWQAVGCVVMATIFSTILTTYYEEPLRKAWRKSTWRRTLQERAEEGNDGVYSSMGCSNMAYAPLRTEDTSITTSSSEEDLSFISVINEKEHL